MNNREFIESLKYNDDGLIPAIVQDEKTKDILMLAYMNKNSLLATLETFVMTYYSRSRKSLWIKGETSGNKQYMKKIFYDCDSDTLLFYVEQIGSGACHTGSYSCFYREHIIEK